MDITISQEELDALHVELEDVKNKLTEALATIEADRIQRQKDSLDREAAKDRTRSIHWHLVKTKFLNQNNKCAVCGGTDFLQVHHIKPFHLHPELELDTTNLITLCMGSSECHLKVGHGGNFKYYNPDLLESITEIHSATYLVPILESIKQNRKLDDNQ